MTQGLPYGAYLHGDIHGWHGWRVYPMIEEIQAVGLAGLVVAHYFLIRGCFAIREAIPHQGGAIAGKIDRTADLLDELAQLIADMIDGQASPPAPLAHTGSPIADILTTFLMKNTALSPDHATTQQQGEIYEINQNQTQDTQIHELDPSSATVPNR